MLPQRTFRFISMFGYGVVLGATWEFALVYAPTESSLRAIKLKPLEFLDFL